MTEHMSSPRQMEQRGGNHITSDVPRCPGDRTSDWQLSGFTSAEHDVNDCGCQFGTL